MTKIIRAVTDGSEEGVKLRPRKGHRNLDLIEGYIPKSAKKPLHCRRTLDQYSYYMLETTDRRDEDQVVFRWAKERSQAPILMVDQLWLWVLPDVGTVITSLPNTHRPSESFDIRKLLSAEILRNKERDAIQSPDDLVGIVLSLCLNIMTRVGPSGVKLHQCFQSSINTIVSDL
ncbi:hypothetical protein P154DRAFT_452242 [Amniculicola lignicola CBS 123094]|uniref:Uncharacterized protein n=1 Tax=Amniculicola lignicola CBS 123094 TaxID=1392246 RepID=A0A6A5VTK4_9PLEO|nr:hypothetical protein P154DRAFT_452242 [Amniculicola lignicola CBS 123094]